MITNKLTKLTLCLACICLPAFAIVEDVTSRTILPCNGSVQTFGFSFSLTGSSTDDQVLVWLMESADANSNGISNELARLVAGVDYTVSGINYEYDSGGTITTTLTYSSAYKIVIDRAQDQEQDYDISDTVLSSTALETLLDQFARWLQEHTDKLSRTIMAPVGDPLTMSMTLPGYLERAGGLLGFDVNGVPTMRETTGTIETFTELTDTPDSYSGQGQKVIAVNVGETGVEFVSSGTGDMLKSVYDVADDDFVDGNDTGYAASWNGNINAPSMNAVYDKIETISGIPVSSFTQDSGVLVGTGAGTFQEETGATLRTSIGVGTGDSPQFTSINLTDSNMVFYDSDGGKTTYADIATAIAAIGATVGELRISSAQTLTANAVFPSTLGVVIPKSGSITKASTYTLDFNGPFECGWHEAFIGFASGNVTFADGSIDWARSEWWGAKGDDSTDCTDAINFATVAWKAVEFTTGVYLTDGWLISGSGQRFRGVSGYWNAGIGNVLGTNIRARGTQDHIVRIVSRWTTFRDIEFDGDFTTLNVVQIYVPSLKIGWYNCNFRGTLDDTAAGGDGSSLGKLVWNNSTRSLNSDGTHTGGNNEATVLTDSTKSWSVDSLIGYTLFNSTDGSSGTITSNTSNTITCSGGLSGGTDNDWDTSDIYYYTHATIQGDNMVWEDCAFGTFDGAKTSAESLSIGGSNAFLCRVNRCVFYDARIHIALAGGGATIERCEFELVGLASIYYIGSSGPTKIRDCYTEDTDAMFFRMTSSSQFTSGAIELISNQVGDTGTAVLLYPAQPIMLLNNSFSGNVQIEPSTATVVQSVISINTYFASGNGWSGTDSATVSEWGGGSRSLGNVGTPNTNFLDIHGSAQFGNDTNYTRIDSDGALYGSTVIATADDTTPDVTGASVMYFGDNTGPTEITDLDNPRTSSIIKLVCTTNTNPVNILDVANFRLSKDWTPASQDTLTLLIRADNYYIEIARSTAFEEKIELGHESDTTLTRSAAGILEVEGKVVNPMTSVGDTVYGGASGTGTRLAAGTNGFVYTMAAGIPSWAAQAGGGDMAAAVYDPGVDGFVDGNDTTYAASWNGDVNAPTMNAVYDKIETLSGGHDPVTLHASATTGGMSLSTQEISNRAATNAQTGYATAAQITAQEASTAHITADGSSHTFIDQSVISGASPTFDGANITGVDAVNVDIADAGSIITATDVEAALQENRTAIDETELVATHAFNGKFVESIDFLVSEAAGTVTGSLEQTGGGDLTEWFSDGSTAYDTTPADTIDLTAYVGTATVPVEVFVYVLQSGKGVMVATNSGWPTTEHIKVANLVLRSAAITGTDGLMVNRNWNDHSTGTNNQGHISHINERIRQLNAAYDSGIALTLKNAAGAALTTTNSSTAVEIVTSVGAVYQMHKQTFPATDMYVTATDDAHITNQVTDEGGAFSTTTDLVTDITVYVDGTASGAAIGVNKYFNIVVWGIQNKTGEESHVMINLPTGQYNSEDLAIADAIGFSVYDIPEAYRGVGFLIARLTFRLISGPQWTYIAMEDLRGQVPSVSAGVGVSTTAHDLLTNLDYASAGHTGFVGSAEFTQDSGVLVGTGAGAFQEETGATLRTSIGVGTGDSPQFTAVNVGHASDTTLARSAAGKLAVAGVDVAYATDPHVREFAIINPNAVFTNGAEFCVWRNVPAAITITKIDVTTDNASYELNGDLQWFDSFIGRTPGSDTVINDIDTTSGVRTDSSITAGAVEAGKDIYLTIDPTPSASMESATVSYTYSFD